MRSSTERMARPDSPGGTLSSSSTSRRRAARSGGGQGEHASPVARPCVDPRRWGEDQLWMVAAYALEAVTRIPRRRAEQDLRSLGNGSRPDQLHQDPYVLRVV